MVTKPNLLVFSNGDHAKDINYFNGTYFASLPKVIGLLTFPSLEGGRGGGPGGGPGRALPSTMSLCLAVGLAPQGDQNSIPASWAVAAWEPIGCQDLGKQP